MRILRRPRALVGALTLVASVPAATAVLQPTSAIAAGRPGASAATPPPCRGSQLSGNFSIIRNSEGAGNVVYALELINHGAASCAVRGLPGMQLLGRAHEALPSHVRFAGLGPATAVTVVLRHGVPAWASARFSGDVPGVGEPTLERCERTAYFVRATGAGAKSAVVVPVRRPTPVCEHGTMSLSMLSRVRPTL